MATTYTVADQKTFARPFGSEGDLRRRMVTLTAPTSSTYTTGGDTLTAAALGLARTEFGTVDIVTPPASAVVAASLVPQSDGSLKVKLLASGTAEFGSGATTDTLVLNAIIYGHG